MRISISRRWAIVAGIVATGLLIGATLGVAQQAPKLSAADQAGLPEYVPVAGPDGGTAGYILAEYLVPDPNARIKAIDGPFPVVATDKGGDRVGSYWGSIGFVSNDELDDPGFSVEERRGAQGWTPTTSVSSDG